jgi:UDP-3-O-[3-hydroxymyristoyl] N-acetylglucosamine deacetylase
LTLPSISEINALNSFLAPIPTYILYIDVICITMDLRTTTKVCNRMSAKVIKGIFNTGKANSMPKQQTLKTPIHCSGTGVHTGLHVSMLLKPAPVNTGIVFKRIDIAGKQTEIPATWDHVVDSRLCTVIGADNGVKIATIEHLLAAFYGCGVDNAIIEIDGPEVPIMDGSAAPFVFLIDCAGLTQQNATRRAIKINKPISAKNGQSQAILTPSDSFYVHYDLHYEHAPITKQSLDVLVHQEIFKTDIARARSFGFLQDVDKLRAAGFALGSSFDNALVISDNKIMNEDGLRYCDELVRHKILDCIGDLYLAGAPIIGHFSGYRSGHSLNFEVLKTLFEHTSSWEYTEAQPIPSKLPENWDTQSAFAQSNEIR